MTSYLDGIGIPNTLSAAQVASLFPEGVGTIRCCITGEGVKTLPNGTLLLDAGRRYRTEAPSNDLLRDRRKHVVFARGDIFDEIMRYGSGHHHSENEIRLRSQPLRWRRVKTPILPAGLPRSVVEGAHERLQVHRHTSVPRGGHSTPNINKEGSAHRPKPTSEHVIHIVSGTSSSRSPSPSPTAADPKVVDTTWRWRSLLDGGSASPKRPRRFPARRARPAPAPAVVENPPWNTSMTVPEHVWDVHEIPVLADRKKQSAARNHYQHGEPAPPVLITAQREHFERHHDPFGNYIYVDGGATNSRRQK